MIVKNSLRRTIWLGFIAGLTATLSVSTGAKAEVFKYFCEFKSFAQPDGIQKANDFVLEFTHDTMTNDAFITGNNGVSSVYAVTGANAVTFLEKLSSGAVQSTTVTFQSEAVHSRHTIIGSDLVPSQYYGTCEQKR